MRATLLSNRATTLLKLERREDALADIEASLTLSPTAYKALRTRARLNLHFEKYDGAVADFKSALEQAEFEGVDADVRALRAELKKAETALKRSKTKDYYKILGTSIILSRSRTRADCTSIIQASPATVLTQTSRKPTGASLSSTTQTRVATRRSSSSSLRRMVCSQTHAVASAMTMAKTRTAS